MKTKEEILAKHYGERKMVAGVSVGADADWIYKAMEEYATQNQTLVVVAEIEKKAQLYANKEAVIYEQEHPFPRGFDENRKDNLMAMFRDQSKKDFIAGAKYMGINNYDKSSISKITCTENDSNRKQHNHEIALNDYCYLCNGKATYKLQSAIEDEKQFGIWLIKKGYRPIADEVNLFGIGRENSNHTIDELYKFYYNDTQR